MLVEPMFWLYTSGKVTLNKMVEDFLINTMSRYWKFEEFSSLRGRIVLFSFYW